MRWTAVFAIPLIAILCLLAWALIRRIRQRLRLRTRRTPRLRHPVVLAHGMFGFDKIAIGGRDHSYFRGVTAHLTGVGAEVHRPRLPSVAYRGSYVRE